MTVRQTDVFPSVSDIVSTFFFFLNVFQKKKLVLERKIGQVGELDVSVFSFSAW